ncbi:hypothetical protein SUGI_0528630 [Cryptomeria japonica]|nr:hypothetical protein SUGI_0528630 [Cryptomeria japonica]
MAVDVVLMVVKKIVGEVGSASDHRYQVKYDILALFVSILLKVGISKFEAIQLCKVVFRAEFLGDLNTVVNNVDDNLMVPFPVDYRLPQGPQARHQNERDVVNCPLLTIRDERAFEDSRVGIMRNVNFFQKWLGMKATVDGNWFYVYFIAEGYEPPRVPMESSPSMGIDGSSVPSTTSSSLEGGKKNSEVDPSSSATKCPPPHGDCVCVERSLLGKGKRMSR